MPTEECDDEIARTQALQELIAATVAALGEEKAKPFELDAYFEGVETCGLEVFCPRVRLVKR